MRKVIMDEWIALDGVVQRPSSGDEDTAGGFERGSCQVPYFDELSMTWTLNNVMSAGGYILGRRTYEIFAAHWPNAPEEDRDFSTRPEFEIALEGGRATGIRHSDTLGSDLLYVAVLVASGGNVHGAVRNHARYP
jgi:dihydrofolate reductase